MALDESPKEHDVTIEIEGLTFLYDSRVAVYLENLRVEYSNSIWQKGFHLIPTYSANC